ncbi:MAG: antibiotic biosynthesis monooxygenase [Verrucomicrobiales bacterium]|nr:antibiotic biosynthesis monooxygenase [Verrucomicrobiales bacterium]
MAVTRLNYFAAKAEQREALARFLFDEIQVVINAEGCLSCRLLCDYANPLEFVILESWESVEAHQKAAGMIPKEQIMSVMQYFGEAAQGRLFSGKNELKKGRRIAGFWNYFPVRMRSGHHAG